LIRDPVTAVVIQAAMEVHSALGAGLLESAYEECLCHELSLRNLAFERQVSVPIAYKGIRLDCGYRLDILIPGYLIIEIKATERLLPIHQAQLITYLRLTGIPTGLLINFNVPHLRQGIRRLSNALLSGSNEEA
jgi:GxxExxY protein